MLMNDAGSDEGRRVGGPRHGLGTDQCFERGKLFPGTDPQRLAEFVPVLLIGQEESGRFRALLLKTLQDQYIALVRFVRQQSDGSVILSRGARPFESRVGLLLTLERLLVQESFPALPNDSLGFAKVQSAFEQRYPRI